MTSTAPAKSEVTAKQHILLMVITLVGTFLILYFIQTRSINPKKLQLDAQVRNSQHQLTLLQSQLATREAQDLPAMRASVAKAQESLRTAEIAGTTAGPPFLNDHNLSQIALFQSNISDLAAQHRLAIRSHASINSTEPQLQDLILRELHVRGTFVDFLTFIESLGKLPHRIIIIKIEISTDPEMPGRLTSMVRYSV